MVIVEEMFRFSSWLVRISDMIIQEVRLVLELLMALLTHGCVIQTGDVLDLDFDYYDPMVQGLQEKIVNG